MINDVIFGSCEIELIIKHLRNFGDDNDIKRELCDKLRPILDECKRIERIEYLKKQIIGCQE